MAFRNPPLAGTYLVRAAIQSPNYVQGTTGWSVNRDGTSEFNAGTFRGSIEAGPLGGQHFWVNNPNTGDVIDVYNSANKLVFSIDPTGRLVTNSSVSTANIVINGANLLFEDTAQNPKLPPFINAGLGPDLTSLNLVAGHPQNAGNGVNGASIILNTGDTSASEWIEVEQRGINGAMIQTDIGTNANQMVHVGSYKGTVIDGFGDIVIAHNAAFTPVYGFLQPWDWNSIGQGWQLEWFANPFNATNMSLFARNQSGAIPAVNTVIGFHAVLYG